MINKILKNNVDDPIPLFLPIAFKNEKVKKLQRRRQSAVSL